MHPALRLAAAAAALTIAVRGAPAHAQVAAVSRGGVAASTVKIRLTDDSLFLENLVYDAASVRYYGVDVKRGRVVSIDAGGGTETFAAIPRALGLPLSIAIDPVANELWVGTAVPAFPAERGVDSTHGAALVGISIATRTIVKTLRLPHAAGGQVLGDVICSRRGDVYATDSRQPVIYRVERGADTIETWVTNSGFRSLQGLAFSGNESALFVADYSHGLFRVDARSRTVAHIADAPNTSTNGVDGLRMYRGALILVQNGGPLPRVVRVTLDPAGTTVRQFDVIDQNLAVADEPTNGVIVNGEFVYPSHVPWNEMDDAGNLRAGARLRAPVLLSLPLSAR